ncbi:hypothetical protein E2I00_004992, partial [Balaenoptera physalus]
YLRLPGPGWSCLFSFIVSPCGQEGPGGGLDLVCQHLGRSGPNRLHCLGPLRERLTIWAAMDSILAPSSVQGHNLTEDARDHESWQNMGDYSAGDTISQPQMALEEVPDPLASSQEQSLPGSLREHMAKNQSHLPNREPDQVLSSSARQKHVDKLQVPYKGCLVRSYRREKIGSKKIKMKTLAPGWCTVPQFKQTLNPQALKRYQITSCESPAISNFIKPCAYEILRQYRAIHSAEQHHAYKQDFETDYAEYRTLHARVGAASQRFRELGAEMKSAQRGTPEHKMLEEKIVQEYKKFRKRYPGYREEKRRCEYLHQKLSHIKGLILEFEEKNRGS